MLKIWNKINQPFDEEYLTPTWKELKWKLEEMFLNGIPEDFLEIPLIQRIMTATNAPYIKQEKEYLKQKLILKDNLLDTSIHHLYHLEKYTEYTERIIFHFHTVIEWGGGFGDMAVMTYDEYLLGGVPPTYIIIDIPIVTYLQYYYLKHVCGKDVNVIHGDNLNIVENKINLIALPFLEKMKLKCDVFISTWAITESNKKSIDYVLDNKCFNAKYFLIGYEMTREDQFPFQKEFIEKIKEGSKIINIDIISPYQFYLFK